MYRAFCSYIRCASLRAWVSSMPSPEDMAFAMPTSETLAASVRVSSTLLLFTSRCRIYAAQPHTLEARPSKLLTRVGGSLCRAKRLHWQHIAALQVHMRNLRPKALSC